MLEAAVDRCLQLAPDGVMLSGGIDSVLIAAFASKRLKAHGALSPRRRLRTYGTWLCPVQRRGSPGAGGDTSVFTTLSRSTASLTKPARLLPETSGTCRKPNAPVAITADFHSDEDDALGLRLPASNPGFLTSYVCFIDLHLSGQSVAIRPYHRPAKLVQPRPRGLITAQAQPDV